MRVTSTAVVAVVVVVRPYACVLGVTLPTHPYSSHANAMSDRFVLGVYVFLVCVCIFFGGVISSAFVRRAMIQQDRHP